MKKLEEKNQYEILVDESKNRIYLYFVGDAKKPEDIPSYNTHVKEAVGTVADGYTLMVDITSNTKAPSFGLTKMLKDSQKTFMEGGVFKTAVVISPKLFLQRMTLDVVTKLTGMNLQTFKDRGEAETWLEDTTH